MPCAASAAPPGAYSPVLRPTANSACLAGAYTLPSDTVCRACVKLFASIGRLRRHLTAAPRCLTEWGAFVPATGSGPLEQHPLAPPTLVAGHPAPLLDFSGGINDRLLADLSELHEVPEADVWELMEACIEPEATLRTTVQTWRATPPCSAWKSETAENMLLLLDPSVSAESQQRPSAAPQAVSESMPSWEHLSCIPMMHTGQVHTITLAAPPLDPRQPTSIPVSAAGAYATWIEAASEACARCATTVAAQPAVPTCPSPLALR